DEGARRAAGNHQWVGGRGGDCRHADRPLSLDRARQACRSSTLRIRRGGRAAPERVHRGFPALARHKRFPRGSASAALRFLITNWLAVEQRDGLPWLEISPRTAEVGQPLPKTRCLPRYSRRRASIGSRAAARRAGKYPNTIPTKAEKTNATTTMVGSTINGTCNPDVASHANSNPSRMPISPPNSDSTVASTRNCRST